MSISFIKRKEDFTCSHCVKEVLGNGYTNHCPHCLWSKHVDISPGDREAKCGGEMRPVEVVSKGSESILIHECVTCGHRKSNKIGKGDNFEELVKISVID